MTNKKCEGIDCAWCMSIECPTKESKMADKEQVTNSKEQIIMNNFEKIKACRNISEMAFVLAFSDLAEILEVEQQIPDEHFYIEWLESEATNDR